MLICITREFSIITGATLERINAAKGAVKSSFRHIFEQLCVGHGAAEFIGEVN